MSQLSSPFNKKARPLNHVMLWVIAATIPGLLVQTYYFGFGTLINLCIASVSALACEALILKARKRAIAKTLKDNSALVTAWLLALALPPLLPWWMTVLGVVFAISIAKQLYGGLGNNLFNPAMIGYVLLLISFPLEMTSWLPPFELAQNSISLSDTFNFIFTGTNSAGQSVEFVRLGLDGYTMATPLDHVRTELNQGYTLTEIKASPVFDGFAGLGWMWLNIAFLLGGLVLAFKRICAWQIPAGLLLGVFVMSSLLLPLDADHYVNPAFHLFSGATMLGAFFIATDPVSASTTPKGRWIFGFGIGAMTVLIRTFGGYPDAIAFAVLFMNMMVPLLDYYTKPKPYGARIKSSNSGGSS